MGVSAAQAKQFIETISPIIQDEAKARGYKVCSPIIAQACVESAYGTSKLGYLWHNYFGMKTGSSWHGKSVNLKTNEEYNSQLVSIRDNFRVYDSMEDGVKGYFDFINTKRYANLRDATTPEEYLRLIKQDGYATSSSYVNTCMNVVNKYNLTEYDDEYRPISPDLIERVVDGAYGNGKARELALTKEGYKYSDVQKKINELNKRAKEILPEIQKDSGDYWPSVLKLMLLSR